MRRARHARHPLVALSVLLAACSSPEAPAASSGRAAIRMRDCTGPAGQPPASLAVGARGEEDRRVPLTSDDRWAALARRVPGGFAGVLYDGGQPVLLLTDPSRAAAAKAALAPELADFDVAHAEVRGARWNFAELYDWYGYLLRQPLWAPGNGVTMSDIDEQANRIYLGAQDMAARDRLAAGLSALELPCDLVLVGVTPPARID